MDYLITFQKENGDIFQRRRKTWFPYRVGEKNNYGWTVLDIKYEYKGNFYSKDERDAIYDKIDKKRKFKDDLKKYSKIIINKTVLNLIMAEVMLILYTKIG